MCFFHHGVVILLIRYVGLLFLTSSVKVSDEIFNFLDFIWWVCFVAGSWVLSCLGFHRSQKVGRSGNLFSYAHV